MVETNNVGSSQEKTTLLTVVAVAVVAVQGGAGLADAPRSADLQSTPT